VSQPRPCIFVTGAASGIGRATCELFSGKGWFVGAFDVDEKGLESLREALGDGDCLVRRLDVTDKLDYEAAVAAFGERTGKRLDLLFNNAGIGHGGWLEDVPYEATLQVIQVNLIGVLNGIYAALPLLKQTPNSLCFTTSSSSATYGMPGIAVYSATKHAVKGLTEALSVEFSRLGVRAADVLPGLIDTAILRSTPIHSPDLPSEEDPTANAPKRGPFRLMPPESVAEAVWKAYHSDRLHWYVPPGIAWLDRVKAFAPRFLRNRFARMSERARSNRPGQEPTR
jgi:NAD(P)-dependent dehydrogenase (short-subunit alcohol dehydrogenase family)